MNLDVVSRLAAQAARQSDLDDIINAAQRQATPEQLSALREIERSNRYRVVVARREGTADFEGRVLEALRVLEVLLSLKNKKTTLAGYTRRSLRINGPIEALRKVIAKRDSSGLRILAEHGRLDCAFEQIALEFPHLFAGDETLSIARETLGRERGT